MDCRPIGIFDSGMGGLSVWKEIRKLLPHESLVYLGDGKNCPYGYSSRDQIMDYTESAVQELLRHNVKLIVLACNTATSAAIKTLRERYDIPFVGMEPAVKPAVESTRSGVVGVLATESLVHGDMFNRSVAIYSTRADIITAVGRGFVKVVEEGQEHTQDAYELISRVVSPVLAAGADEIVLGCTHYPFLESVLNRVIREGGYNARLVDPAPAVAKRVAQILRQHGCETSSANNPVYEFRTFAGVGYLEKLHRRAEQAWSGTYEKKA